MFENLGDTLTRKYGPLPGYAWVGLGAGGLVLAAKLLGGGSASGDTAGTGTRSFLTLPPDSGSSAGAGGGAGGAPDPAVGYGEPIVDSGGVFPTVDSPALLDLPGIDSAGSSSSSSSAAGASSSSSPSEPVYSPTPLPALAPYADELVARGVDPSTGGLLPGAGNSSGVPGSPVAYGPGLYDLTPTVATPQGPVPGGVYRAAIAEDPYAFASVEPESPAAVVQSAAEPVSAVPPSSGESLIMSHFLHGRDVLEL